jgi:hypothetical protein
MQRDGVSRRGQLEGDDELLRHICAGQTIVVQQSGCNQQLPNIRKITDLSLREVWCSRTEHHSPTTYCLRVYAQASRIVTINKKANTMLNIQYFN